MNKVLVKLDIPLLDEKFDILIPPSRKIYYVIQLILKAINEMTGETYETGNIPLLYDKVTAEPYDVNLNVKEAGIVNGTEIILL